VKQYSSFQDKRRGRGFKCQLQRISREKSQMKLFVGLAASEAEMKVRELEYFS